MQNIISLVTPVGIIALFAAQIWTSRRTGEKGIEDKVMTNYKILNEQLNEQIKKQHQDKNDLQVKFLNIEKNFIELRAKLEGKDAQIKSLNEIIANRNPELVVVLNEIKDFMKQLNDKIRGQGDVLTYQTGMMEGQVRRDDKQDVATDLNQGNILRKPFKE